MKAITKLFLKMLFQQQKKEIRMEFCYQFSLDVYDFCLIFRGYKKTASSATSQAALLSQAKSHFYRNKKQASALLTVAKFVEASIPFKFLR